MSLCRKVRPEEVYAAYASELIQEREEKAREARIQNKGWTEGKIQFALKLEKISYRAVHAPLSPHEVRGIDWGNSDHVRMYHHNREKKLAEKLLEELKFTIIQKAEAWGRRWVRSKGLDADDFASVFRMEVFNFVKRGGDWPHGEYYIIESLEQNWKRRAIDLVRGESTNQREWERGMKSLDAEDVQVASREDVAAKAIIQATLADERLTRQDRSLLRLMYSDPKMSNQQLADELGLGHKETVRRIKARIKEHVTA